MHDALEESPRSNRTGIRELRSELAAFVRRAGGGERIIVSVDGRPVAQLGPLEPTGAPSLDDLAASGMVRLPGRDDHPAKPIPAVIPVDARPRGVLAELRGGLPESGRRR